MRDYLAVDSYKKAHPNTSYPAQLAGYLVKRFNLQKEQTFVDVGCGEGFFLRGFAKNGLSVIGLDGSAQSATLQPDLDIRQVNLDEGELPLPDNSCDIIFSRSFVEHFFHPEVYMSSAFRCLKPGGLLITMTPDWHTCYALFYDAFTHRTPFTWRSLTVLYELTGFEQVQVEQFYQLPCVWRYPALKKIFRLMASFVPVQTRHPFFRWVRTLMLLGVGYKPLNATEHVPLVV